jgi:hypothetical protein
MVKATVTIRQMINTESRVQVYFAANQALFNQVASFYFDVIQAHIKILDLSNDVWQISLQTRQFLRLLAALSSHTKAPLDDSNRPDQPSFDELVETVAGLCECLLTPKAGANLEAGKSKRRRHSLLKGATNDN